MKHELVKLLEDSETLEKAFHKISGANIGVSEFIQGKIVSAKKDYAITLHSGSGISFEAIHPYGTQIMYRVYLKR